MVFKKTLCSTLAMLTLISTCLFSGINTSAAAEDPLRSYEWEMYDENSVIITNYTSYNEDKIVVPSHIEGYPVVALGENSFENCWAHEIVFPDTLEIIEDFAFRQAAFRKVGIPKNVKHIGKGISTYCSYFTAFTVDKDNPYFKAVEGVLFSKDGTRLVAYPNNKEGYSYTIPNGVEYISEGAFYQNHTLTSITFPQGLKGIDKEAFKNCFIYEISWPDTLEYIDENAFINCTRLENLYGFDNFYYIAHNAFENTAWYQGQPTGPIYLGRVLYSYKSTAFAHCPLEIEEGTLRIENYAFKDRGPSSLYIPESVVYIDPTAFHGSSKTTEISVSENNQYYASENGMLLDKEKKVLYSSPRGNRGVLEIPDSVEIIFPEALRGGSQTNVVIPENVYYIGDGAFSNCGSMQSVKFPEGLEYIGDYAFKNCILLEEISLPQSVIHIGKGVFEKCSRINKIVVPERSVIYSYETFEDTAWYRTSRIRLSISNNCLIRANISVPSNGTIEVPEGVISLASMAFADKAKLKAVVLPKSLQVIGPCVFENCPELMEITIPASVDEIWPYAMGYTYVPGETEESGEHFPVEGFVIKGYSNSCAEDYAILNGFTFIPIGELEVSTLIGDTDFDGNLTIRDATLIQKFVAGMVHFGTQKALNADFNTDGNINVRDATAIQKNLAGLPY